MGNNFKIAVFRIVGGLLGRHADFPVFDFLKTVFLCNQNGMCICGYCLGVNRALGGLREMREM